MSTLNVIKPVVMDVWGIPHHGPEEIVEDDGLLGPLVVSLLRGTPECPPSIGLTRLGHLMLLFRRENVGVLVTEFRDWTRDRLEQFLREGETGE